MKKTTLIIVLMFGLGCSMNMYAQTCKDIIFPFCPRQDSTQLLISSPGSYVKSSNTTCGDSIKIDIPPIHGTVTYVETNGNINDDSLGLNFLYETNTNCFSMDSFKIKIYEVVGTNTQLCDSVTYILNIKFQCETPDDIFCCIPPDGPDVILDVLQNDNEFINTKYPGNRVLSDSISNIVGKRVAILSDYTISYDPLNEGIDSFSYEVFLEIVTSDGDTITICDVQTCYIQVDNCLYTTSDMVCIVTGDTVCIDPLANDMVTIILDDPVLDSIGCTNPEPVIAPKTLTMPIPIDGGSMPWSDGSGSWCFTDTSAGTYTYTYDICTDVGGCATDSIIITVNDGVPCSLKPLCDMTLTINNTYNNGDDEYFEASESIFSMATVNIGADVTFDAGNFILIEDGFFADNGAVFLAKIDGCDNNPEVFIDEKTHESDAKVVFNNYPNPFTGQTTIEFTLTKDALVTLLVFDSLGRKIATLLETAPTKMGTHQVTFNGADYSSGVYYYTIQAGDFFGTQKMTLIK